MDKTLDGQPIWLVAIMLVGTGIVLPALLALIGRYKASAPAAKEPAPSNNVEVESPWMVQNLLQMQEDIRKIHAVLDHMKTEVATILALTINHRR